MTTTTTKPHADDKISPNQLFDFARGLGIGLTAGYIGNIERWGDDRCFKIWAGSVCIWSCDNRDCTRRAVSEGFKAVKVYSLGYTAGKNAGSAA